MRERLIIVKVFVILMMFTSCSSGEKPAVSELEQEWVVIGATRDGRATETLNGAYFHFSNQALETNFMGEKMSSKYTLKNNRILVGEEGKEYQIEYLDRDSLHLSVEIKGYPFHFFLHERSKTE